MAEAAGAEDAEERKAPAAGGASARKAPATGGTSARKAPAAGGTSARKAPATPRGEAGLERRTALLIDWGGVLTSNLFTSFHAYCVDAEIDPRRLLGRFRDDPQARELLIALEKGELDELSFERRFAALLEVEPDGLIDGLFAGVRPDEAMVGAVRQARAAGVRTALVSNSWGVHRYPRDLFAALFDGIVISGEEGIRKPSRRMYELGAERAGVSAHECVYVDDLQFNLAPARELGMATVHHTSAETTIPRLERLLGVLLGEPERCAPAARGR
ncbi:MAG TPA: HAD family phosphatase [Solirubrobacteraceae bacterium]|nr:HAD family phosphatase [Solirubrobacteraceae bacterium]